MKRAITVLMALALFVGMACDKKGEGDEGKDKAKLETPEVSFDQIKKSLVNRDADLMWDLLSDGMIKIFTDGHKELLAKPIDDLKRIAVEGMTTVEELKKYDTKGFFKFYFNYKKHEVYRMNSAELLERKVEAVKTAKILKVDYEPADKAKATTAIVTYEMSGEPYTLALVKQGTEWRLDSMEGPKAVTGKQPAVAAEPEIEEKAAGNGNGQPEAKPVEAKPAEAKPAEAKPAEAKPAEAKPAEAKPAEAKPAE